MAASIYPNVSSYVASANNSSPAQRTITAWKDDAINFADYKGADPTGTNDNSSLFATALVDCRTQGKPLFVPAGTWGYANPTTVQSGDRVFGSGPTTIFKYIGPLNNTGNETLFQTATLGNISPPSTYSSPTVLSDFRLIGGVDQVNVSYSAGIQGSMIQIQGVNTLIIQRISVENAGLVGLQISFNYYVDVEDCNFFQVCRDNIMFSGSKFARIVNNTIRHGDDNGISAHSNIGESWGRGEFYLIQGNSLEDCPGISCQAASRTIIADNQVIRPRESGIAVTYVGSTAGGPNSEGMAGAIHIQVSNNIIQDVIARNNLDADNQGADYIEIGSIPPTAGSGYGVPGTNLKSLGGSVLSSRISSGQTWQSGTIYPQGSLIVDSNGKVEIAYPLSNWAATTTYALNTEIFDASGNVQLCTTSGVSSGAAPTWATGEGQTTTDNTVIWTNIFIMPANQATPSGTNTFIPYQPESGNSAPTWPAVYNQTCYDGGLVGTPGIRWQQKGGNSVAGVVEVYPYIDNMLSNSTDTSTPLPPGLHIDVIGNQCIRTISVSQPILYSSLGFGNMFTKQGYLNPWLGAVELITTSEGILINSHNNTNTLYQHFRILDNFVMGIGNSIQITPGPQIRDCEIRGNRFIDFLNYGINFGTSAAEHRITINNNHFDGDPYMLNRGNAYSGTWQNGTTLVCAFKANNTSGILAYNNHIRNCSAIDDGNADAWLYKDNWIHCNPAVTGFSNTNSGIGNIPAGGNGFLHVIEDCNPSNTTYGNILNMPILDSTAIPTSGIFVQGLFTRNTNPALSGGKITLGWIRLTTSSGNVSGVDWTAAVATSG